MGRRKAADIESQTQQTKTQTQSQLPPPPQSQIAGKQASQKTMMQMQPPAVEGEEVRGRIKWDGDRGILLAYKFRDEYKTKWIYGSRTSVAKQWAIDLGVGHLDPRGHKTKAAVAVMLTKYTEAKELFLKTGAGEIIEPGFIDGKPAQVPVSLTTQCKRICKHWEILWGAIGNIKDDIAASSVGLNENGMKAELVLGEMQGGGTDKDDEVTEDEDTSQSVKDAPSDSTTRASSTTNTSSLLASQADFSDFESLNTQQIDDLQASNTVMLKSRKRKAEGSAYISSPSPIAGLDITLIDDNESNSEGDSAYEELEPVVLKQTPAKKAVKNKRGDIAEALFGESSSGTVKKKKSSKMEKEMDLRMSILKAHHKRLEIEELKYRGRAGEKSSEQRAHEIRMAEWEFKIGKVKAESEANRVKQLEFQLKIKQIDRDNSVVTVTKT